MWITRRTDYATRALLALTLADGGGALKLQEIADRTQVPPSTLEQVMLQLRGSGFVRSERGPAGGYRLNRAPAETTLEEVVRLFQGPLAPIACATRKHPEPCPMEIGCSMREVWGEVRDATIEILQRTTFADLARRAGGPWVAERAAGA
jgi:Rrf2 family protein